MNEFLDKLLRQLFSLTIQSILLVFHVPQKAFNRNHEVSLMVACCVEKNETLLHYFPLGTNVERFWPFHRFLRAQSHLGADE